MRNALTHDEVKEILLLHKLGFTTSKIARAYDVTHSAVSYHIRPHGKPPQENLRQIAKTILSGQLPMDYDEEQRLVTLWRLQQSTSIAA